MKARYFFTEDMLCMAFHPQKRSIAREWFGEFFDPHTRMLVPSWKDPVPILGRFVASVVYGVRPARLRQRLGRAGR